MDMKIKNSKELEFAVFCIENVAAKLGMNAERVYRAFTKKSNILNGYIVPEYEALHTRKPGIYRRRSPYCDERKGCGRLILYHGSAQRKR